MAQRQPDQYGYPPGSREWDQGKDWDGGAGAARGTVRRREDDEWAENGAYDTSEGDWKRRKMNPQEVGYDDGSGYTQGYPAQQDYSGYGYDYAAGRGGGAGMPPAGFGPPGGGFGRGRGRGGPSEPSEHIIFLGLDPDFTENDLRTFLVGQGLNVVSCTIIRDRNTGMSRSFGFAQFASVAESRKFLQPNFPFVQLPPPASHAFGGVVNDTPGRRVKIDFSQSAHPKFRGEGGGAQAMPNDGSRDMGSSQAAVLLLRGLDPLTSIDEIEEALRAAEGAGKEGAKGMKRVVLIRDRITRMGWGFAFVEFKDIASAATILGCTMSAELHPNGFRISDKPIAVSFAHMYSFQPLPPGTPKDEYCIASTLNLGGQEGWWTKYWDEGAGIAEKKYEVEEDPVKIEPAKEKKKKLKARETDEALPVPTAVKLLSTEHAPLKFAAKKADPTEKRTVAISVPKSGATTTMKVPVLGLSAEEEAEAHEDADEDDTSAMIKVNKGTRVAPLAASKKTFSNINKWNAKQEELATEAVPVPAPTPALAPVKRAAPKATPKAESPAADNFDYGDPVAMTCLLCSRKFNSVDQLRRHDQESDLHKKNLQDEKLREVAKNKKADAARARQATEERKYRDRASERREIYGQPEVPPPDTTPTSKKHRSVTPPPPPPPVNLGKDESNVGNKLLKKMGWTEGTGLGTEGEGRVDPIETALYTAGVGLGASKAQPVGKYPDGIRGYVAKAKDSARDRYNQ